MKNGKLISLVLVIVFGIVLVASGCGGGATTPDTGTADGNQSTTKADSSSSADGKTAAAKPLAGKVVRVLLEDNAWHRNIQKTVSNFENETGIKVTMEFMPEVQSREKVNLDLTTGTGLYDVFLTDEMYFQKFAKLGTLEPLGDYVNNDSEFDKSDFPELALQTCTFFNKLYAIPWRNGPNVLFYRKDLVEKYGLKVPDTMDELYTEAVKARNALIADGNKDIYGITMRGVKGEGLNMWIIGSSILPAFGAKWLDSEGKPCVNSPEFVKAIDFYAKTLQEAGSPDAASQNWDDCYRVFQQGKAVFFLDSAIQGSTIHSDGGIASDNLGTVLIPAGPTGTRHSGLYCPSYVMSAKAKEKEAAWEFIKFATTYEQMLSDAVDGGNFEIGRLSIFDSAEFNAKYTDKQLNQVTKESKKYAKEERPMIIAWPQVGDIIGEVAQRVIAKEIDAKKGLDEAQTRIMDLYNQDPNSFK